MTHIKYMRALIPCKCTKCNYHGYDADFENLVSGELIKGEAPALDSEPDIHSIMNNSSGEYQIMYQHNICPECGKRDTAEEFNENL